jgi:membrane protein YdbS with pleckstrin-like domain
MFCEQCGKPLTPEAKFCAACGFAVSANQPANSTLAYATTGAERISDDEPLLVLKPVFMTWVTMAGIVPITLFMTVWAGGFCGGFSMLGVEFISKFTGLVLPKGITFAFFACAAFFGIPILSYIAKKQSYRKTEYRFFADRLEYFEGYFNVQQKVIDYRNILEVNLQKGVFQKQYGLGTVILSTAASGVATNNRFGSSGIQVRDIERPDDVYLEIRQLIKESQWRGNRQRMQ